MASLEDLAAQFAAYKDATDKKIAELEKTISSLSGSRPKTAGVASKTLTKAKPGSATPQDSRRNSLGKKQDDDAKSVDNFVKGKPPVKRPGTATKTADVPKVDLDEKRITSYQVGKRKVYVVTPSDYVANSEDQPVDAELQLEYVHGYNGREMRNNLFYADKSSGVTRLIYSIAATGVYFDPANKTQTFFNGHNEDILSLALHPSQPIVATGQLDPKGRGKPYICVWNYQTMAELARIENYHDRGVPAVAFSPDGKYLATVGDDDSHSIGVWDWQADVKKPAAQGQVAKDQVYGLVFSHSPKVPEGTYEFCAYGVKLLKSFTMVPTAASGQASKDPFVLKGNILSSFKNTNVVQKAFHSAVFLKSTNDLVIGTATGDVYIFRAGKYLKTLAVAHGGPVGAVIETKDGFASAGADGKLHGWKEDGAHAFTIELGKYKAKAMDFMDAGAGRFVVGTSNNSILEVDVEEKKANVLLEGHSGEIWGCATHPSEPVYITCANDKTLRAWNVTDHSTVPGKLITFKDDAICCNFSPDGKTIAVGFLKGNVALVNYDTFTVTYEKKHRAEQVSCIAFSPNGQLLGLGSWDQMAELIDVESKSSVTLKGHTSSVTHLSFSEDSKFLITNSRDYEILFWNTEAGKRVDKSLAADCKWWDFQCILGFPVRGIFGAGQDGTDNNAAHVSYNHRFVATGNDTGEVSLFRYPAHQKSMKKFVGHSAHVTNVRFTRDDSHLISTGGNDLGVFQWKVVAQ